MCLTEVGDLPAVLGATPNRVLVRTTIEIDLEPTAVHGCLSGTLIALRAIPGCPGFRQLTVAYHGDSVEAVVPLSTLIYIYCNGRGSTPK